MPQWCINKRLCTVLVAGFCGVVITLAQTGSVQQAADLLRKGRADEAKNLLLECLRDDPHNQAIHGVLGQIAFSQQEFAEAVEHFQKAPVFLAKQHQLVHNYAEALLETKSPDAAIRVLELIPPENAEAQFECGLLLARHNQFLAAEKHFQLAENGYPQPRLVAYDLALAQFRAGEFAKSAATLESLRRQTLPDGDVLNLLGEAYLEAGESRKALDTLKEAIEKNPRDERNYVAVAKLCTDENRPARGLPLLDQGLRLLPNSYRLLLERGDLRLSAGQYPGAESDYRRAGEIQPESDSPKIGLAVVHLEIHSYPQAEAELQQVLRSSPSNFMVHYLLGELYIREGQNAEAVKYLEQAAASGFAPAHNELGKLYLKSNDLSSATREFETAIKLDPDDTTPYYQLSILYRRSGEKEKAQMALDRVKSLNDAQRSLGPVRSVMQRMRKFQVEDAVRQ